jgi:hypothetical protein
MSGSSGSSSLSEYHRPSETAHLNSLGEHMLRQTSMVPSVVAAFTLVAAARINIAKMGMAA